MQYDVDTPQAYLAMLDDDWRKESLLTLRQLILDSDTHIVESIQYKMLCFTLGDTDIFHLNAQKGYVSLYCGDTSKVDPEHQWLEGLNKGKGCIRFSKTKVVSQTLIGDFIKKAVSLAKSGHDIGC